MKTFTGRALPLVLLLLSLLGTGIAQAAVTASLDRQRVALGDSLRLTITADGEEELSAVDLAPLQRDVLRYTWLHERYNCQGAQATQR